MKKTGAERQALFTSLQKKKGLKRVYVWAYPEDNAAIRAHAEELKVKREGK